MQSFIRALENHWRWIALGLITLVPRLYLLRVYDVELSQDGFEAVRTLNILQTQGVAAVPRDLLDRLILHPFYMLLLTGLRLLTPAPFDFYFAARLLSTLIACVAVVVMFEFTRRAFGEIAAWVAAIQLAFAPSFLWESVAILSSTTFLALDLAVLFALTQSRYRLAALLALLAALTRYEGIVLIALVFIALCIRDLRARKIIWNDWLTCLALAFAFPATLLSGGIIATGNALEFLGAQSMAAIWLQFFAPGDFWKRGQFFITQYPALFPTFIVWLGLIGALVALIWHRQRATALLIGASALYLIFDEALVWLNYTTLETRFLMYPGLPLLVFAGIALTQVQSLVNSQQARVTPLVYSALHNLYYLVLTTFVAFLAAQSYQQGNLGMRFVYNMMASQREMAAELAQIVPAHQTTNVIAYTGNAGALALFGEKYHLEFAFTDFRFAPGENPEQFLLDQKIQFVIYPVGNAFAQAKYPYLAQFEEQTHGAVTFKPLTQFATSTDNQLYSIWSVQTP